MPAPKLTTSFQSVELDPMDVRLEAKAAEKGIPTLVTPKFEVSPAEEPAAGEPLFPHHGSPPTARPSTGHTAFPNEGAQDRTSRLCLGGAEKTRRRRDGFAPAHDHDRLRDKGIPINDADMIEDGRRFRIMGLAQMRIWVIARMADCWRAHQRFVVPIDRLRAKISCFQRKPIIKI